MLSMRWKASQPQTMPHVFSCGAACRRLFRGMRPHNWVDAQGHTTSSSRGSGIMGAAIIPPKSTDPSVPFVPVGIDNGNPGPVMWRPIGVYILWLGNVSDTQKDVFRKFIASIPPNSDPANTGMHPLPACLPTHPTFIICIYLPTHCTYLRTYVCTCLSTYLPT